MKRFLALCLLPLLLLSGCRATVSLPRATEPRNLALASVLGVDVNGETITALAATHGRGGDAPELFQGNGDSLAAARLVTRDQGAQNVSYAHVEDIVLSEDAAASYLSELLSYSFQNGEQSMESHLWVLRDAPLEALFQPETNLAKRLTVLKTGDTAGTSLPGCTLREAAARLLDDGALLLPALTMAEGNELHFAGYALLRDGVPVGYVEGDLARGVAVLSGASCYWTRELTASDGETSIIQLHSRGIRAKPEFRDRMLSGLSITCSVDGQLLERWSSDEAAVLAEEVKLLVSRELHSAVAVLQEMDSDGANLRRRAGLAAPLRWGAMEEAWTTAFATLPVSVTVEAKITASS